MRSFEYYLRRYITEPPECLYATCNHPQFKYYLQQMKLVRFKYLDLK